jgi:pyruvate formate lyase activating enzyme
MRIAGLEKNSVVDYPGKLAAVLFTPGCNMDCFYCHNRQLLSPGEDDPAYDPQKVLRFLHARIGFLEGVVISGGEPTLQKDLEPFLAEIRAMGYAVKLDTNGARPWVVESLIDKGLVNFVAMDIKAPPSRYEEIAGRPVDLGAVERSVLLLRQGRVDYEFRTTFAPPLSLVDIVAIATWIHGARRYVLQQYRPPGLGVNLFGLVDGPRPHPVREFSEAVMLAGRFVRQCCVRGLDLAPRERIASPPPVVPLPSAQVPAEASFSAA